MTHLQLTYLQHFLYFVPSAYFAVRSGNINKHRDSMIGLYIGGFF